MSSVKKIRLSLAVRWHLLIPAAAALAAAVWLYIFRLGSLTHRLLSPQEAAAQAGNSSLRGILHNPINAPYKLLDFICQRLSPHSAAFARLASVVPALLAIALFFSIMQRWHGRRTAVLATALFGTSGWMLHVGRLGVGTGTLVLVPLALTLFASWLSTTKRHEAALLCMALMSALALFSPGAVWFLIASYLLIGRVIGKHIAASRRLARAISAFVFLAACVTLGYVLYRSPHTYRAWLALPSALPTPLTLVRQWLDSALFLFVRGPYAPALWLAHTPILDVFTTVMTLVGGYFYVTHYKNLRSHMLAAFLAIGSALVALNGADAMSFVVPVAYLVAGTGLTFVLHEWLSVFPRNPVARGIGIGLVSLVVVCACAYHLTNYFVAWRYSPTTAAAFRSHP